VPEFSPKRNGSAGKIRFGVFEADMHSAELRRNGRKVRLQDQPFQILVMLLEQPGEVVTRDTLRASLWPVDTFVDFDHGLNAAVKRLRDALGDSAENPRFVETLARRGYRFIAPVHPSEPSNSPEPAAAIAKAAAILTIRANPESPETAPLTVPKMTSLQARRWRILLSSLSVLLMGTGAGWVAARRFNPILQPVAELRLTANPPDDPILSAVISPDAKYLAFADRSGLFLRVISTGETHSIALPEGFKPRPAAWFPDGNHVLVTKTTDPYGDDSLWNVSVLGGPPRKIMDEANARGVSPDGKQIAFVRGGNLHEGIWVMSADGDHAHKVFGEPGDKFGGVAWSPDGRRLAFARFSYKTGFKVASASLWTVDLASGEANCVLADQELGEALAWPTRDRLVYSLAEPLPNQGDSNLWTITIDPKGFSPTGHPVRLTSGPDKKVRLSTSGDGKQLTFLRWRGEPHIYVADLDPGHGGILAPRALSLDEGRNLPFAFTPDGKSVLFTSDRDGPAHIFRQAADQAAPDLLVGGPDSVAIARLNPNGTELLYLLQPRSDDVSGTGRLMSVPLTGGTPRMVLQAPQLHNFQCARVPSKTCVFGVSTPDKIAFVSFDPRTGDTHAIDGLALPEGGFYNWSLSPDGSTIAVADWRRGPAPSEILLLSLRGRAPRKLALADWAGISSIDWAADGRNIWTSAIRASGEQALLSVDLQGRATLLLQDLQRDVGWAIPSPDGRRIAFWEAGGSSNAWLLRGF
jgi:DNA-binding winged helix-turn-helix (wHTH) protein/Tol biopolymer transport system component